MKIINQIFTIIKFAFIGVGWGSIIHYITNVSIHNEFSPTVPSFATKFDNLSKAVGVQLLLFALLGILQGYSGYIFEKENISLLTRAIIHYLFILVPLFIVGNILHWFHFTQKSLISFFIISTGIYFIIFTILYFVERRKIITINQKLNN
ncbi:DUF3021 domain-containing protein [Gemella sp. GH3]|uniref:DUF3021 domain-containing protein n=1 Tax=unclassified Gemella TaxID=2624949 RepID=UPI0015D095EF|nr:MULTISPECIES: DUF3021 domain-containing protein [unclassified Gemella]MBF0713359.1 DUF3021 domain-containing protein [Gemella sp. GH3.1]NYS50311.1 DUF3021 domain-containing protein [Gemella sp. GH3]